MKNKFFYLLLGLSLIILFSCQDDNENFIDNMSNQPLLTKSITPEISPYFQWDDTTSIKSPYYDDIILPWYNGAITQIPDFILRDYHHLDGWELVYNFIVDGKKTKAEEGKNYFILYNKFTGILRVFYYHMTSVGSQSTTFWKFGLNGQSALLNCAGKYFASPINEPVYQPNVFNTNITTVESKSVYKGWNCFDVELAYDPNQKMQPLRMSIASWATSTSNIELNGRIDLKSKGTIISKTSSNKYSNLVDGAAKSVGTSAKDYIKEKLDGKEILPNILQNAIPSILSGGTSSIVKAGINLVFGSFLGRGNKTTTTKSDLSFSTNGTIKLNGEITSTSGSEVVPISSLKVPGTPPIQSDNLIPSYNKPLGVWNLKQRPVLYQSKKYKKYTLYTAEEGTVSNNSDHSRHGYSRNNNSSNHQPGIPQPGIPHNGNINYAILFDFWLDEESIQLEINEELSKIIEKKTIDYELVYYNKFHGNKFWDREFVEDSSYDDFISPYTRIGGYLLYSDSQAEILTNPRSVGRDFKANGEVLLETSNVKNLQTNKLFTKKFVVKVTVTLYPKAPYNTDPIVMTRSYIPEYRLVD